LEEDFPACGEGEESSCINMKYSSLIPPGRRRNKFSKARATLEVSNLYRKHAYKLGKKSCFGF
jgi:hypothetical protein